MITRCSLALGLLCSCAVVASAQTANPPANICVELRSWIDQAQTKARDGAAPTGQPAKPAGGQQGSEKTATAVEAGGENKPRPDGQDEPQRNSGISGPVTDNGPGAAGPQGRAQESSGSGAANPKPDAAGQKAEAAKPPEPKAPPPTPTAIDRARQAAGSNDLDGCSATVRDMRLAGVDLPAPLLALAALRPELRNTAPQGPAPGVPPIPPSGVAPGEAPAAPQAGGGEPLQSAPR
ncbi:MAG: hypothetical protein ACK4MV_00515 [Beijerinckiaceae bacterium]